jgi:hypothetical protein
MIKENLDQKPSWLELPEEEKVKHIYWACWGYPKPSKTNLFQKIFKKKTKKSKPYKVINTSKEEAEAYISFISNIFVWNQKDAKPITLQQALREARCANAPGVRVIGFQNGQWTTLKTYLSPEPLIDE